MQRHVVGKVDELPPGERKIVPVGGKGGIGVFNVDGTFYALRNMCPAQRRSSLSRATSTTRNLRRNLSHRF